MALAARGKAGVRAVFELREYSVAEILADGVIHALGIALSVIAVAMLLASAGPTLNPSIVTGLSIYGATLIAMFSFSAAYNLVPQRRLKPLLRRFDQAAIFLKIAGTYTPLVILIGSAFAYALLAIVWALALAGAVAKLVFRPRRDRYSVPLYLALGWASVSLIWPMMQSLPPVDAWLIVAGGLLYTAGVVFHVWDKLKYQNAIWHAFVLAAALCHFTAVAHAAFSMAL